MNKGGSVSDEILSKLIRQPLFSELTIQTLKEHIFKINELHLLKNEIIFRGYERYHNGVYFVVHGKVSLYNHKSDIDVIRENDVVGITTYLSRTMYENTAKTLTDADIIFIPEIYLYNMISTLPEFRSKFIDAINQKLHEIGDPKNNYLYRMATRYVLNFVKTPMITINASASIAEAVEKMKTFSVDSLLVSNRKHTLKGLLSKDDLLYKYVLSSSSNKDSMTVADLADTAPILVPDELPAMIALYTMREGRKNCAIVTSNSKPIGVISETEIRNSIKESKDLFSSYISSLKTLDELKYMLSTLHYVCEELMTSPQVSRYELIKLSQTHIAIQEKVYQITSDYFYKKYSFRLSDHRYNFVLLGAAARQELDLRPRIINAIILDDRTSDDELAKFIEFSNLFQSNLADIGYVHPQCNKPILNNFFIKREKEWYAEIDDLSNNPKHDIRTAFFCLMDIKSFDGDNTYSRRLDEYIRAKVKDKPSILLQLLNSSPQIRIPISSFGAFILESDGAYKGKINLQNSGLYYIAMLTRLLSLYLDSTELSTISRIKLLKQFKLITPEMAEKVTLAFDTITATLLNEQIALAYNGKEISTGIVPSELSLVYQEKLLRALQFLTEYSNQMRSLLATL